MEHECNLVASGQKNKQDILDPLLAKMKECFLRANEEAHKLDDAMSHHFPRLGMSNATTALQQNFGVCGICQGHMILKRTQPPRNDGRQQQQQQQQQGRKLVYCPTCQQGWGLPGRGMFTIATGRNGEGPVTCPICQFSVIRVGSGDGYVGNGYTLCPKCFSDPPMEHGGGEAGGDFRCFSCHHPTCPLATGTSGGSIQVYACPFCRGHGGGGDVGKVTLRKNSRGFVLSCSNFQGSDRCPYTVWLPRESSTISVDESRCESCSSPGQEVRKLRFGWKVGSVPPQWGRTCTTCILCDTSFRQDLQIRLPQANQVMANPRRRQNQQGGRQGTPQARRQNPGGQDRTCFRCGQPGHFANRCPASRTQ